MLIKDQLKKRQDTKAKRLEAFGKTLQKGVSDSYLKYLNAENKENRMIEKYL